MKQVTFSQQSLGVINRLPKTEQLDLVEKLSELSSVVLSAEQPDIGKFYWNGRIFYRIRLGSLRIYFEKDLDSLLCQFILPKNSLLDFLVRCNLPASEEAVIENHQSFWDYLESLRK